MNILGHFAPLNDDCEMYELLKKAGIKHIREISRCEDFAEYEKMWGVEGIKKLTDKLLEEYKKYGVCDGQ